MCSKIGSGLVHGLVGWGNYIKHNVIVTACFLFRFSQLLTQASSEPWPDKDVSFDRLAFFVQYCMNSDLTQEVIAFIVLV